MALLQPAKDPFAAAAGLLQAAPGRVLARRFLTLSGREFEGMLREFQAEMTKVRLLRERYRKGNPG